MKTAPAASPVALNGDGGAVQLGQVSGQRQADPQSPVRARGRAVPLAESIERVRQKIRRDSDPVVGDLKDGGVGLPRQPHVDVPPVRRELHRVRNQVGDNLLQAIGIA